METTYKKKNTAKGTRKVKDARVSYVAKASAKAQVIDAVYDGRVFLPQQAPTLKANTRVRITVEQVKVKRAKKKTFLDTARFHYLDELMAHPFKVKGFQPLTREEAHARR